MGWGVPGWREVQVTESFFLYSPLGIKSLLFDGAGGEVGHYEADG